MLKRNPWKVFYTDNNSESNEHKGSEESCRNFYAILVKKAVSGHFLDVMLMDDENNCIDSWGT
jgi:hypothetical protein